MGNFSHLHVHTEYSLLDGAARIKKVTKVAKEMGMPGLAITDHGNMYGVVQFYNACVDLDKDYFKEHGHPIVKPIIGCEFYVCRDISAKGNNREFNHLVLLAKDDVGYNNLCLLNTIAFCDGFYYKPRIDYKALEAHHEGLVCLSACIAGDVPQAILRREFDEAERLIQWYKSLFGEDYYFEIQNHNLEEQIVVNEKLREYGKKYNIKLVATNDVHYIYQDDAVTQDVLLCVQTGKTYDDPDRWRFDGDQFYFKSEEEMAKAFPNDLEALANTQEIVDKCNYNFIFGQYMYPKYIPITGQTPEDYMRDLVEAGLKKKYKEETKEIRDRIEYEFGTIKKLGYIEYYLIVWDYINAARERGISVGPGRGSGVGSIIAYLIGITNVDPIKYGLFFERFLNPERVSAPDFDVDFQDNRREEVFDYVKEKYGEGKVAKIITFGTMAAKNAIKDVARVLRVPYADVDKVTKAIPNNVKRPNIIAKCFGLHRKEGDPDFSIPELVEVYNTNPEIKKVVDIADKLEDSPRQTGIHACGVIIGRDILKEHIPLAKNGDIVTTQFVGGELETLGHLKMDFLGLCNLSDIELCIKYIKENHGVDLSFEGCTYDDQTVYELISTGNTKGMFQIESPGFQKFLKELKPNCLEDIIAGVSLYRPGPMDSIPDFIHNKHNPSDIKYISPVMEPILNVTYGCIVYQEQVMKIVQELAGYTLGRADSVRKYMGKKKLKELQAERQVFLYGCPAKDGKPAVDGVVKRGIDEGVANKLWDEMEKFGSYAFNKSHAAAYAVVTYETAYLKTYYESEFLTALLNNRITKSDEIKNYVTYIKSEKIEVLPPDINESETYFKCQKDGKIRFGLAALKNVGIAVVDSIVEERNRNGKFKDMGDFFQRVDTSICNKRSIESFILAGAFDCFGKTRSQLMAVYDSAMSCAIKDKKSRLAGQFSMFGDLLSTDESIKIEYPDIHEYDLRFKLKKEKETLGTYISGHPLDDYIEKVNTFNFNSSMIEDMSDSETIDEIDGEEQQGVVNELEDGMNVVCGGIISDIHKMFTKNGNKPMAVIGVEDLYGTFEVMLFNKMYEKYKNDLAEDSMLTVKGHLSLRDGQKPIIIADSLEFWNDDKQEEESKQNIVVETKKQPAHRLYLQFDINDENLKNMVISVLKSYYGTTPVSVQWDKKLYNINVVTEYNRNLFIELSSIIGENNIKYI